MYWLGWVSGNMSATHVVFVTCGILNFGMVKSIDR